MTGHVLDGDALYFGAYKIGERPASMSYSTWDRVVALFENAQRDVDGEIAEAVAAEIAQAVKIGEARADAAEARADAAEARAGALAFAARGWETLATTRDVDAPIAPSNQTE